MNVADIGLLVQFNPKVTLQLRMQLIGAQFDGDDLGCAVLQGVIGETAGAAADVEHGLTVEIQFEAFGYRGQFESSSTDISVSGSKFNVSGGIDHETRLSHYSA